VAALIVPQPEVINFDSANADQDSQDSWVGCLESQRWIEAPSPLLNERKVKSGSVSDRLYALGITACDGNRWIGGRRSVRIVEWDRGLVRDDEGSLECCS